MSLCLRTLWQSNTKRINVVDVDNILFICLMMTPKFANILVSIKRQGGLMVSALDSGARGPGSSTGQGHSVGFLGKTLNSHSASLPAGV